MCQLLAEISAYPRRTSIRLDMILKIDVAWFLRAPEIVMSSRGVVQSIEISISDFDGDGNPPGCVLTEHLGPDGHPWSYPRYLALEKFRADRPSQQQSLLRRS